MSDENIEATNAQDEADEVVETEYLNTDLMLVATHSLENLAQYLDGPADLLSCDLGPDDCWYVVAEAEDSGGAEGNPVRDITALLDVIEGLPKELAAELAGCRDKELNIGLAIGATWSHVVRVPAALLGRAAALGIDVGFTTYPVTGDMEGEVVYVDEEGNPIDRDEFMADDESPS